MVISKENYLSLTIATVLVAIILLLFQVANIATSFSTVTNFAQLIDAGNLY